jgi:serine protease Do
VLAQAETAPGDSAAARPAGAQGRETRDDAESGLQSGRRNAIVLATERVAPAVVSINVIQHQTIRQTMAPPGWEYFDQFFPGMFPQRQFRRDVQGLGSGVIVSPDGYVITNDHVVSGADEIVVTLSDGRQFKGRLLDTAPNFDLALVKVDAHDLPTAPLATAHDLYIGEWAIAIGSPFGFLLADTQPTVTVGVISALNRDIKQASEQAEHSYLGMIQTDAAINPGNSGGPLVDAAGQVVGINTFIVTPSGGSVGIGFAVPIERAEWLIHDVQEYGRYRQPWSGLTFQKLSPNLIRSLGLDIKDPQGFIVTNVDNGSPSAKAGLRAGDVVRSINGVPLKDVDTVSRLIYEARVGDRLAFVADRSGERVTGTIVLAELPRAQRPARSEQG